MKTSHWLNTMHGYNACNVNINVKIVHGPFSKKSDKLSLILRLQNYHLVTMRACLHSVDYIQVMHTDLKQRFMYGNNMGSSQPLSFFKSSSQMK